MSKSLKDFSAELRRYSEYKRGWDGYNAPPFNEETLCRAGRLLNLLEGWGLSLDNCELCPCPDGTILVTITVE